MVLAFERGVVQNVGACVIPLSIPEHACSGLMTLLQLFNTGSIPTLIEAELVAFLCLPWLHVHAHIGTNWSTHTVGLCIVTYATHK